MRLLPAEGKPHVTTSGTELDVSSIASGVHSPDTLTGEFKVRKKVIIAH